MTKKIVRLLVLVGLVGLVSACSNTFKSDVSRFHELPQPAGETVEIVPADPAKAGSLEFASYANIVGSYLGQQGYKPANGGKADLIVELDYSVDDGKVLNRYRPSRFAFGYGYYPYHYGFYHHYWHSPYFYDPFWGAYGPYDRARDSYVSYTRKLELVIRPNKEGAKNLFEATVESRGRSNKLHKLMPLMVQALFTNFPGQSGTTDKIVIELGDKDY
ncbi:DUF4136 domain-containing protein [Paremcibacter congregatus]|jgi:hypothetical protein|uniref:Lipoprotein transmembrane n=1 Tax=Paremcibacter congregatus TaxID=2043170 RepID=A0A2G4YUI4_9PROT|nr:DUF4136 domain-containing protein [Paremcibacter congregatus]PHZ86002.1 lipoprotein transmembrane [Paremcibacter congregatus]QDE26967.1 DUF4136 domain-containing protein [Paremcibacter congregatus]|tara:strand:+ start:16937 stop:17587 length:651 start_codon:yes stop_codon:yes gene_type:complete